MLPLGSTRIIKTVRLLGVALWVMGLNAALHRPLAATTFIVTSGNDAGPNTLRQAIIDASAAGGSTPHIIEVKVDAVTLTSGTVVYDGDPELTINGDADGNGAAVIITGNGIESDPGKKTLNVNNLSIINSASFGIRTFGGMKAINVTTSNNSGIGLSSAFGDTTVTNVTANNNLGDGIVNGFGNIYATNVIVNNNGGDGLRAFKNVIAKNVIANGNRHNGIISVNGDVSATNVTANNNGGVGITADWYGGVTVDVESQLSGNGWYGVEAFSNITATADFQSPPNGMRDCFSENGAANCTQRVLHSEGRPTMPAMESDRKGR